MARTNQIETHPERLSIEMMRAAGVSLDKIAEKFGAHRDAIHRHWKGLTAEYKAALIGDVPREQLVERAISESGNLLDHYKMHRSIVEEALIAARTLEDLHAVSALTRTALKANEAIGKLTGEIRAIPGLVINNNNQQINLMETPAFRLLEGGLLEIAEKHPAARPDITALVRRLQDVPDAAPLELEASHA